MAKLNIKDLSSKSVAELKTMINDFKRELLALRFQAASGQLENPALVKQTKQNIARVFTVINSKNEESNDKEGNE